MLDATFRPLHVWPQPPTPASDRQSGHAFKAGWQSTLSLLEHELRQIDARDVVIEIDVEERDIRNDGWPRADARPRSVGVVLSFRHPEIGPLRYPCDRFGTWQANLRAIALALEALRKVDRYGVTRRGEQYTGWKALPASTQPVMTTEQAAHRVAKYSGYLAGEIVRDAEIARNAIRQAQAETHPDRGGSADAFALIGEAKRILTAHFGGAL